MWKQAGIPIAVCALLVAEGAPADPMRLPALRVETMRGDWEGFEDHRNIVMLSCCGGDGTSSLTIGRHAYVYKYRCEPFQGRRGKVTASCRTSDENDDEVISLRLTGYASDDPTQGGTVWGSTDGSGKKPRAHNEIMMYRDASHPLFQDVRNTIDAVVGAQRTD